MVYKPPEEKHKLRNTITKTMELMLHIVILIVVPVVYLELETGFDKYELPKHINYVYGYWLAYLIVMPIVYGIISKINKSK